VIKVLRENCYSLELIFQKINCRLDSIIRENSNKNGKKQKLYDGDNQRKLIVLPCIKNISESIDRSIDK